eukprot:383539-Prymnesium_polylepis.1
MRSRSRGCGHSLKAPPCNKDGRALTIAKSERKGPRHPHRSGGSGRVSELWSASESLLVVFEACELAPALEKPLAFRLALGGHGSQLDLLIRGVVTQVGIWGWPSLVAQKQGAARDEPSREVGAPHERQRRGLDQRVEGPMLARTLALRRALHLVAPGTAAHAQPERRHELVQLRSRRGRRKRLPRVGDGRPRGAQQHEG